MARETPVAPFRTEELLIQRTWLHALAAKLVRDQAEHDDLVQETWLAALRHPLAGEARDLRQWLGAVLRNRWRFERRTRARRSAREQERSSGEPSPAPAELVEQAELQSIVVRAVLALDEPYRSTVLRRYFGAQSCRAIAREEGVSDGTVRSRLKRALDLLRAELDGANGGERRAWVLALVPLARLARTRNARPSIAAVAAAALAALWLGWSRSRGTERIPLELAARAPEPVALPVQQKAPERAPLTTEVGGTGAPGRLAAGGRLELLVLATDGRPIPGAAVVCGNEEHEHHLRTDDRGSCRVPDDVWSVASLPLQVDAHGFVRHDFPIDRGQFSWSSPFLVTLTPAVALEGRLRDADTARPIEGAELTPLYGYWSRPLPGATSGTDGTFHLESAPRGQEIQLLIRAPGYPAEQRLVQVSSTARAYLELELHSGVELHGHVVDAWTGAPLAGARVYHDVNGYEGTPGNGAAELARSDAAGEVAVRALVRAKEVGLLFVHPGYCSVRMNPDADGFEVPLLPAAVIEGTLSDGEGRAMSTSEVILEGLARYTWFEKLTLEAPPNSPLSRVSRETPLFVPIWRTQTDEQGRFRMEVVPGHPRSQLYLRDPRQAAEIWTLDPPLLPGETRRVEIPVQRAGTIVGRLRINGAPSPGRVRYSSYGKFLGSEWTRPDGTFELRGVPLGAVALQAYPDEYEPAGYTPGQGRTHPVLAEVEVGAGITQPVELELELPTGTIRGRVTSPSGQPRAHLCVLASAGRGNGFWRGVTDASGVFELRVPAEPGSYALELQGCAPTPAQVGAEGIELVTTGYGRIRVRAEDASSHALVERVTLFVRRPGREWKSAGEFSPGTNGFAQWELEAGALELAVDKADDGYPSVFLGGFVLDEDAELELDAALERVAPVEFLLTNPPLPGVCILRLENTTGLPVESGMLGSGGPRVGIRFREGRASVPSLASGEYRLSASFPDVMVEPGEIRLGSDRSRPIELTWHRSN
jgi:RNA polymerase sigma factor (sigma-70 family)